MILDGAHLFDSAAAITVTRASTNVVDLGVARDLGVGKDALKVEAVVTTAFTSGGAGTLQAQFQGSTDNSSWTTYGETGLFALAALTAGARLFTYSVPRPPAGVALPRYWRINWVNATAAMTAGAVTAYAVLDANASLQYPAGLNVPN